MDIARSFSYILDDEQWWKKALIGGLLSLIPVVGTFYMMGYVLQTLQNIIKGQETPLPEVLEDLSGKIVKGLILFLITFVYMLPLIIIAACAGGGAPILAEQIDGSEAQAILPAIWGSCFGCLALLYGIAMSLLLPFVWGEYAMTEQIGSAFRLGKIFSMLKSNIGPAFIVIVVGGLAGMLASLAGTLLCGIGLFFTMFYAQLVTAFLYGSLYKQAQSAVL